MLTNIFRKLLLNNNINNIIIPTRLLIALEYNLAPDNRAAHIINNVIPSELISI